MQNNGLNPTGDPPRVTVGLGRPFDNEMKTHYPVETVGMIGASVCVCAALASIRWVKCVWAGRLPDVWIGFPPWITLHDDGDGIYRYEEFNLDAVLFIAAISLLAGWIVMRIVRAWQQSKMDQSNKAIHATALPAPPHDG